MAAAIYLVLVGEVLGVNVKNRNLAQLKNKLKKKHGKKLKRRRKFIIISEKFSKGACFQKFLTRALVLEGGKTDVSQARSHQMH